MGKINSDNLPASATLYLYISCSSRNDIKQPLMAMLAIYSNSSHM